MSTEKIYETVFARVLASMEELCAGDTLDCGAAFGALLLKTHPHRLLVARSSEKCLSARLCCYLLTAAAEQRIPDPALSRSLAEVVLEISQRLPALPEVVRYDLEAEATAEWANADRILGDLASALRRLDDAERLAARGSADVQLLAKLRRFRGSALRDAQRYTEAEDCLEEAARLSRQAGDLDGLQRAQVSLATILLRRGKSEEAILHLGTALQAPATKPTAIACGFIATNALLHLGRTGHARRLLRKLGHHAVRSGSVLFETRVGVLHGQVQAAEGRHGRAVATLGAAAEGFAQLGFPRDAAIVALDQAASLLESGQLERLDAVAPHLNALLEVEGLAEEATALVLALCRAIERGTLSARLLATAGAALRRSLI